MHVYQLTAELRIMQARLRREHPILSEAMGRLVAQAEETHRTACRVECITLKSLEDDFGLAVCHSCAKVCSLDSMADDYCSSCDAAVKAEAAEEAARV